MASSFVCDLNEGTSDSLAPRPLKRKISVTENVVTPAPLSPDAGKGPSVSETSSESPSKKNKCDETSDSNLESKRKLESFTSKLLELLVCPVCTEVVRSAPNFCRVGHIICSQCKPKVKICPTCREPDIDCRNVLLEQFALPVLAETQQKCMNHIFGCKQTDLGKQLQAHLVHCVYEQVKCPASHRNACTWQGNLIQVVSHAAQGKCAQVLNNCPIQNISGNRFLQILRFREENIFRSSIGDFNEGESVFKRSTRTYWKPVILLSQSVVRYFLYLIIYRENNGDWFVYMRSLAHKELARIVQYHVKLSQATSPDPSKLGNRTDGSNDSSSSSVFSFVGNVHDSTMSDADIINSGDFLRLSDAQVRKMIKGKTMFEYTISIALRRNENGTEKVVPIHPKPDAQTSEISTQTVANLNAV